MSACTTLEAARMTTQTPGDDWDRGFPPAFRAYLLDLWPQGRDWVPPENVAGSSLGPRIWWQMHETRRDGGAPPLLDGFLEAMDKGRQGDELRARGEHFAATGQEVGAVIQQLRESGNKATRDRLARLRRNRTSPDN